MLNSGIKPYQCLNISTTMKQLGCNAGHQEVSRYYTRGESEESAAHSTLQEHQRFGQYQAILTLSHYHGGL